ncbi:CPBP family intramembrane metalloprotease [Actinotalea sp. BY-33]|uniref:CPBP family intramembrane metalloprotease n=1 Tax=Actinotalea soli TaxID=2819234 RepID=A0A939RVQ8_9CELL|nr:CPBP family intramembrane glutamic endopeptidase [Actinotalea soli]MBO1751391.1 CPBP family intramembrane metalloprotease [Actinotalea soli]
MLGVVAVAVVAVAVVVGPVEVAWSAGIDLASALLHLALLAPLALIAARGKPGARRALVTAGGLLCVTFVVHGLPRVGPFADLDWNWQGKTIELVWLTVLLMLLAGWAREEVGVRRPLPGTSARVLPVIVGIFLVPAGLVVLAHVTGEGTTGEVSAEGFLYDSGHANLVEELLWRGALLALLDRALGTPRRFFGARVGWGLVLTTLSFGLGHGLLVTADGLVVSPGQVLVTGVLGLLFGWVRARTGSVWLAYLAHCAPELGVHVGQVASNLL